MESYMKKDGFRIFECLLQDHEEKLKKEEGAFFVVNPQHLFYVLRQLEESKDDPEAQIISHRLFDLYRLSLTQRSLESSTVTIPLLQFHKLTHLELRKVKISNLSLSSVKTQLRSLYCNGCDFEESLEGALHWGLESLAFQNRSWKPLKLDFLKSMPWLVELNLSHNNLKYCNLENLKLLITLNLNYNHLTEIPKLAEGNKLRTLLLSNNFITNLTGLENLHLKLLDLSFNIVTLSQIDSISTLKELQYILLENNPCSIQLDKKFRVFMAYKIRSKHPTVKLDFEEITDAEKYRSRQPDQIEYFNKLLEKKERIKPEITLKSGEILDPHIEEPPPIIVKVPKKLKTKEAIIGSSENESPNLKLSQKKTKIIKPKPLQIEPLIESVVEEKPDLPGKYPISCSSSPDDKCVFVQSTVTAILHTPSTSKNYQHEESDENAQENVEEGKKNSQENVPNITTNVEFYDASTSDILEILNSVSAKNQEVTFNSQESINTVESKYEDNIPEIEEPTAQINDTNISEEPSFKSPDKNDESIDLSTTKETLNSSYESSDDDKFSGHQDGDDSLSKLEDKTIDVLKESEDESSDREEIWWHVKLYEKDTHKTKNVCISLLEKSLKEYNPSTGAVRRKWSLKHVQGCVKTKTDPITIEIDFESPNAGKEQLCYIMEYADSQILMKTLYGILESKSLTQKCNSCSNPIESDCKICSVCGNFANKISKSISQSPSESSIGSAISIDRPIKRCESDVETLSNPSLSSVEVIDDRSQSATPSRKKSSEERQTISVPQLGTLHEVTVPLSTLTESSSSGSLTESVITAYDNTHSKKQIMTESLLEENETTDDNISLENQAMETTDKNKIIVNKQDIYSFDDFSIVDERVKIYLHKDVFKNENEQIIALVRCHLWKTGGSDYDGCFVLSNSSVYTFYHSRTDFSEPVCDWLSKADTYRLDDIKQISPLIHKQGVEIKINNIVYFLLLMDSFHTSKLFSFFINVLKLKKLEPLDSFDPKLAQNKVLQQAISGCELVRSSVDPTVHSFTIFKSIEILKDKENEEYMRLGGIVVTAGEFYILPGDLSWIANCKPPQVHSYQEISRLIEVRRNKLNSLSLYFLDEQEASEEVWTLTVTPAQIYTIIKSIEGPWEKLYSVPLEITINYS